MDPSEETALEEIDRALQHWRQGDCVLGEQWFVSRVEPERPLTIEASAAAEEGLENAEAEVRGFMVATQTCDLVRGCARRPYVEVCPLVEVEDAILTEIRRGKRPNYAFVPGLVGDRLVADLDRTMTVEKAVVARWERVPGCSEDDEVRRLALALARKRARVAFPDDFVALASNLAKRMSSKHDKNSEEGEALRSLREIRVRAAPSWDAEAVHIMFWFIRDDDGATPEASWPGHLKSWLDKVPAAGRFTEVEGAVLTLDDLTARDYVDSDPLDLDHLSTREQA